MSFLSLIFMSTVGLKSWDQSMVYKLEFDPKSRDLVSILENNSDSSVFIVTNTADSGSSLHFRKKDSGQSGLGSNEISPSTDERHALDVLPKEVLGELKAGEKRRGTVSLKPIWSAEEFKIGSLTYSSKALRGSLVRASVELRKSAAEKSGSLILESNEIELPSK